MNDDILAVAGAAASLVLAGVVIYIALRATGRP